MVCYFISLFCKYVLLGYISYVCLYVCIQDTTEDQHCLLMWLILFKHLNYNYSLFILGFIESYHLASVQSIKAGECSPTSFSYLAAGTTLGVSSEGFFCLGVCTFMVIFPMPPKQESPPKFILLKNTAVCMSLRSQV